MSALLAPSLLPAPATAQLPSGNWQYHWGDDFSGNALDTTKWSYNYPWGTTHNHDAVMSPDNVGLGDGTMTLTARRTGSGADFTSGTVSTGYTKQTFSSGYIEASIRLPDTPGSWPAFWGLYNGWPPEADIMEYPIDTAAGSGYAQDEYHTAFHYRNTSGGNSAGAGKVNPGSTGDLGGTYHTFGMEWREDDWVGFYFDGARVSEFGQDAAIAQMESMYLILNYAVGGWPGTPNTSEWPVGHTDEMKVDFVRVWKQASGKTSDWGYTGRATNVSWSDGNNWTNGSPNLGGVTSSFDTVGATEQNIDWSGRRTLSVMNLDGDTRYQFGGAGDRLVLGYGNNGGLHPAINVAASSSVSHEVQADLEFAGGLNLTNESAHPLVLSGNAMGAGAVEINGPGIISFDGDNSYRGDTIIDSGAQGPAVARARGSNAFGLGGVVVIGSGGNSTTARVELENSTLISNNININGRTSLTAALVNNSGNNTVTGTINLEAGGTEYRIRSDAGSLLLSGDSESAGGVALRGGSRGRRTLTLEGAGDGVVQGTIEDGQGLVGIIKSGAGEWALRGQNTYSGATTVSAGSLIVDGATGSGGTTLTGDGLLGGHGVVRGGLMAASGTVVRVGAAGLPLVTPHLLIDDFEGYSTGDVRDVASPPWTAHQDTTFAAIESDGDNQTLGYGWAGGSRGVSRELAADAVIAEGETATFFFRFNSATVTPDHSIGLGDQASTGDVNYDDYEAQVRLSAGVSARGFALEARDGDGFIATSSNRLAANAWHNVWMVVDQANDVYDLYLTSDGADATAANRINTSPLSFRNGTTGALREVLALAGASSEDNAVQIDDLNYASGVDLSNPLNDVAMLMGETLSVEGDFSLDAGAALRLDLGDGAHDLLAVSGAASLDGVLEITLEPGYSPAWNETFTVLTAGELENNLSLGGPDGAKFALVDGAPNEVVLMAVSNLPGDFTNDGVVDAADYTVWRDSEGAPAGTLANDTAGGVIGAAQYDLWRTNFGATVPASNASVANVAVPEPTAACMLATLAIVVTRPGRRR
ncbi:Endo-1,3-1,4-beta-glycanase ExsH [Botrimarina colliarenosi]|uniref:Endo-1,3-1,4-beta-glycanase ExsH n=1 Tax=Botrimarina colliarenosi TaxID=2528001 RepID=A0A5C6ALR8_9BACT|nr:glycoside hydrolase family 16 protein [Botrimarina colliarenosi]TWU00580.1 Endo-1,3-1,4-beta-glycanase ExsH [Botrimarina colliarenosi]